MAKKTKINKKLLLKKFLIFPKTAKRDFFSREMKLLNTLIERYSDEFVACLSLEKKYDSIAIILCDSFKSEIDKRFRSFNYKTDDSMYEKITLQDIKFGEDLEIKIKPKTIRGFLNG